MSTKNHNATAATNGMRILYPIFSSFPHQKAHAIHTAKNCEALVRHGAEVELVAPLARHYIDDDPFEFYGLTERFKITKIWSPTFLMRTPFGYIVSSFFYSISLFFYLVRRRKSFDVIYSIELEPLGFVTIPFLFKPYFFELHSPREDNLQYGLLFSRMSGATALNADTEKEVIETFPRMKGRTVVIPSSLDLSDGDIVSKKDARTKLNIPQGAKVAVYTGLFRGWKGLDVVLLGAAQLPDIYFYLVGGEREELDDITIPPNVTLVSKQPYREMPYWRSAADFLLGASTNKDWYSKAYTSPMKLLEYMSFRRPIIVARTRAQELILNDDEAVFYESDDVDSFVSAVKWAQEHPKEARERAERAYIRAKGYSWDARAEKILNLITSQVSTLCR